MSCFRSGALAGLLVAAGLSAQTLVRVRFLEPVDAVDTRRAEIEEKNPLFRYASDPSRYTPWLNKESAEMNYQRSAVSEGRPAG